MIDCDAVLTLCKARDNSMAAPKASILEVNWFVRAHDGMGIGRVLLFTVT
jgi:hypothetical protein